MAEATFISHLEEVLEACDEQIRKAMEECGLDAQNFALDEYHSHSWVAPTGNLQRSINYEVEVGEGEATMTLGSGVKYAPYVEFGTGVYSTKGGRQTPWCYQDSEGHWHRTVGMRPRPIIKPAISKNIQHYKQVIESNLRG